jgi:hypothetical protein
MRYVRLTFRVLVVVILFGFFHYVLPQRDTVRIVSTEIVPNFQTNWPMFYAQHDEGTVAQETRPLRLIQTMRHRTWLLGMIDRGEQPMVYRNEDTGWIWPPYFKFDSSDLQTEADDVVSTPEVPKWFAITHYGWRNRFITVYPNAISIRPLAGPDVRIIPWFNIFFFLFLGVAWLFLRAMWAQFRERSVDPMLDSAGNRMDEVSAGVAERRSRVSRWFDSWRTK